ncbi:MAG: carbohydrate ABC transporter permease [Nocardioidaceae bacterium]
MATATTEVAAQRASAPESDRSRGENKLGWKLAGPALAVMLAVTAWPILQAIYLSTFSYRLTDPAAREFIGLSNYITILTDILWWRDFGVTVLLTAVTVVVELVIGFVFAMVMHRIIMGRGVVRTSILVPYGIITVVSAYAWQYAFSLESGFVNSWFGLGDFDWFGGFWSSFFVICLSEIWKTTPFISLLLLAGLAQVSEDMQEAAKVDGATAWQRLWKVTIPNMKGAILVAVLFRTLDAFRIFDNVFVMTGGANGTESLSLLVYRQIINRVEMGLGSAISVLLFLSVLVIAYSFIKLFKVDLSQARGER